MKVVYALVALLSLGMAIEINSSTWYSVVVQGKNFQIVEGK
jgi:hypothetical protein